MYLFKVPAIQVMLFMSVITSTSVLSFADIYTPLNHFIDSNNNQSLHLNKDKITRTSLTYSIEPLIFDFKPHINILIKKDISFRSCPILIGSSERSNNNNVTKLFHFYKKGHFGEKHKGITKQIEIPLVLLENNDEIETSRKKKIDTFVLG